MIAGLVEALLADPSAEPRLSLLAEQAGEVLGHIFFTRATLSLDPGGLKAQLLSPLAVRPDAQRSGIGGALIREGLARLRQAGVDLVFVLGSPAYYPRFGFAPCRAVAAPYPIQPEHAEAWMVQALTPGALDRVRGAVLGCARALGRREYWGD